MGCIAKFILNVILIRQPAINIYGAPISSVVCQIISFSYGFTVLSRQISVKITLKKYVVKPLIASVAMGIVAFGVYKLLMTALPVGFIGNLLATAVAIILAAFVYFIIVFACRLLNREEIEMLPAGQRIFRLLQRFGVYK